MSLVILFVLMSAGASTFSVAMFRQSAAKGAKEADEAFMVAEAGLDRALFELQTQRDFGRDGRGNAAGTLGEGSFAATLDPAYTGPGQYTLRCVGTVGGLRRGVEAVIEEQPAAILGFTGITNTRMSGGILDSYDSSLGSYASQVGMDGYAGSDGVLGSNFDVDLTGSNQIYGDVTPGPTGSVSGDTSAVSGSTAPASELQTFDPYVYAPTIPSAGALNSTTTLTSGEYRFDSITLNGGTSLTLDGEIEIYVDGDITIKTEIRLLTGSSVTIHHGSGDIKAGGTGIVNVDADPSKLTLLSATVDEVKLSGSSAFHGTIFVPDGTLTVSGGELFGGAVGGVLNISSGAVRQDLGLARSGGDGFAVLMMRPFQP